MQNSGNGTAGGANGGSVGLLSDEFKEQVQAMRSPLRMAEYFSQGAYQAARHLQVIDYEFRNLLKSKDVEILIVKCPVRHGKLCSHDTDVFTPIGWRKHGDLRIGDSVYAANGNVSTVIGLSDEDFADVEVEFNDGEKVIVHENHEWFVSDDKYCTFRKIETKELFDGLHYGFANGKPKYRYHVNSCGVLKGHDNELQVKVSEFATLDAWDGADEVRIPVEYLTANEFVRFNLICTLVDNFGCVRDDGTVVFLGYSESFANDFATLVRSFGWQANEGWTSDGKDVEFHVITFVPDRQVSAFHSIPLDRVEVAGSVAIRAVRRVTPELGRCIEIDDQSKLYLVGKTMKPTHNSEYLSRWAVAWYMLRNQHSRVIICTNTLKLSRNHSIWVRDKVHELAPIMGLKGVDPTRSSGSEWHLDLAGGGSCIAAGVGGSIVGFGANLLVIDDYLKDAKAAFSQTVRDAQWDWFISTSSTRLEPGGKIVLLCCLTGDTLVSMADGTFKAISDIRKGDSVLTFKGGNVATSVVNNQACVGVDDVFEIKLESGHSVRANARHPFLAIEDGELKWIRVRSLTTAHTIVTRKGKKENGSERRVSWMGVVRKLVLGGIASPITPRKEQPTGISLLASLTLSIIGNIISNTGMGLLKRILRGCLKAREVCAPHAVRTVVRHETVEENTCASTIATTLEKSVGCYVAPVILERDTLEPAPPSLDLLNISEFTSSRVVSVEHCGREEVFDIEVDGTSSFFANGMVSHNTQWHNDDLIGRIMANKDSMDLKVRCINLQAIREDDGITKDPLNREMGEALWPERWPVEVMERRKRRSGNWWYSIYQGRPRGSGLSEWPDDYFRGIWMQEDEWPETLPLMSAVYLDPSLGKDAKKGDYSALVYVAFDPIRNHFIIDSDIDRRHVPKMMRDWVDFNMRYRPGINGVESNAFQALLAPDYVAASHERGFFDCEPMLVHNGVSKFLRIRRLGKFLNAGMLKFRRTASNELLISQMKSFPDAKVHDDGPDALEAAIRIFMSRYLPDQVTDDEAEPGS